ncbi:PLP-dependent aminotransferase family protein [Robbsia sp. KACC 23696]|uniref:aminotransferase-like domain-containing protein n=1 Tax=Robbsia sp. KACC 23696 TaxID=3149231 RepID=UPI00325B80FC
MAHGNRTGSAGIATNALPNSDAGRRGTPGGDGTTEAVDGIHGETEGPTLIDTVIAWVRSRVEARLLSRGERLPSLRQMAHMLKVSKATVVTAYDRMLAQDLIESRPGAGFYVLGPAPVRTLHTEAPDLAREVDPLWVTRQSLEAAESSLKPGCGWMPASWMPEEAIRRGLRALSRARTETLSEYGVPLGLAALRHQLSQRLAKNGVPAAPEQIILTDSGSHSLDLLCRYLIGPGDTVLVDDPCYFNFQALLRVHRVRVLGVPMTADGPDLEVFTRLVAQERPRLYLTNSAMHNPTGAILTPVRAHQVLNAAHAHGVTIVEDDIFGDLEHRAAPRYAAFDALQQVIVLGSFSKTLSSAARCGYIAIRADLVDALVDLKLATTFGNGGVSSALVAQLLQDGTYRRYLDSLRGRLADAMGETLRRLERAGLTPWLRPEAGMFVWARLPEGLDAAQVARRALDRDIVLAPGDVFSVGRRSPDYMRFNVSQSLHPAVYDGLRAAIDDVAARTAHSR